MKSMFYGAARVFNVLLVAGLLVLVCAAASLPSYAQTPGTAIGPVSVEAGTPLRVTVRGQDNAVLSTIRLPPQVEKVSGVTAYGTKLVIVGTIGPANAAEIIVADKASGRVIDHFRAMAPSVSPDGRYIAFTRFYPLHVAGVESQYRFYDISQTGNTNRSAFKGEDAPLSAINDVGFPLYPQSRSGQARDNIDVDQRTAHHSMSGFFWSFDSTKVGIVDAQGQTVRLVVADFASNSVRTTVQPLPQLADVCRTATAILNCRAIPTENVQIIFQNTGKSAVIATADTSGTRKKLSIDLTRSVPIPLE